MEKDPEIFLKLKSSARRLKICLMVLKNGILKSLGVRSPACEIS